MVETCGNIGSSDSSEAASATARSALHHQRPKGPINWQVEAAMIFNDII